MPGDENAIVEAVGKLLSELGGPGPEFSLEGAKQTALRLIQDPEEGFIFVIEEQATGQIVGIAAISAVLAVRAAGAYGVLQELWISRDFRSSDRGGHLLEAVRSEAKRRGWQMIEVALPPDGYPALERVRRFTRRGDIGLEDCARARGYDSTATSAPHLKALLVLSLKTFKAENPAACCFSKRTLQRVHRGRGQSRTSALMRCLLPLRAGYLFDFFGGYQPSNRSSWCGAIRWSSQGSWTASGNLPG
ncbi:GNAT family N-acetyltransferase [Bradyrhizobium sp. 87]|uniref:GNAT family N-acetyltransferase n=1 Tax=Bradyrhizobium sp. 87 TaxID=2782682 RepID=UPI003211D30D